MNNRDKKRFIRELAANVLKDIEAKIPEMPEAWDGIELRQYIADTFAAQCMSLSMRAGFRAADRRRLRDYKNEVLVRNL